MATAQKFSTTINGVAVGGLFATIEAVKATASIAKFKFRIRNQWESGSRSCSTVAAFSGSARLRSRGAVVGFTSATTREQN